MRRTWKWMVLYLSLSMAAACNKVEHQEQEASVSQASVEVVAAKLDIPWSIEKLGNVFYISERKGTIAVVEKGEVRREAVRLKETLSTQAEAGLLGFILFPDFAQSGRAAAYYTYEREGKPLNRVAILERKNEQWKETGVLLDGIASGQYHHGGRMKIGGDGLLYVTTGDGLQEAQAQDKSSLSGKILRMTLDGKVPEDNPDPRSYVYSYGHRNPQGLAWDEEGNLFSSEHGASAHDELNKIEAGGNYGWPDIEGDEMKPGMIAPIVHSGKETWAPSGMAYYDGYLYFAALRGEGVKRYHLPSKKLEDAASGVGRVRDVFIEGDTVYFVSNNTDGRGRPSEDDDQLYKLDMQEASS
ncbi:MAG: PQQ-dependent sugar dehydrogenase [Bacillus sp. (in: firmicutes)]